MHQDFESLQQAISLGSQLKHLQSQNAPGGQPSQADQARAAGLPKALAAAIDALDKKAAAIGGVTKSLTSFRAWLEARARTSRR
jgi:hypothetical protein